MVPFNLTCLHCLQNSFLKHHFNLYFNSGGCQTHDVCIDRPPHQPCALMEPASQRLALLTVQYFIADLY